MPTFPCRYCGAAHPDDDACCDGSCDCHAARTEFLWSEFLLPREEEE